MEPACNISVIVVSHDRAAHLEKMLACLRHQDITGFEVIIVTNTPESAQGDQVLTFHEQNIAQARNIGIAAASGAFVAFCDDDALPDPGWLRKLVAPFDNPDIGGTGGFTRGRNGISLQWGAVLTDRLASITKVDIKTTTAFPPKPDESPVLIGTNCAFRKSALAQIGGFDEYFAYYLDDSDISLRLSQAGWKLAIIPDCQVHHSFAASANRTKNRIPVTLMPLGRSKAYFCRKHGKEADLLPALEEFRDQYFDRLTDYFMMGLIEQSMISSLLDTLEAGFDIGKNIVVADPKPSPNPQSGEKPITIQNDSRHIVLAGRWQAKQALNDVADKLVKKSFRVTVICLDRTVRYMQVGFSKQGFWQHSGGQFGKVIRTEPIWRWSRFKDKVFGECRRISENNPIDFLTFFESGEFDASLLPQNIGMSSLNGYKVLDDSSLWSDQGIKSI